MRRHALVRLWHRIVIVSQQTIPRLERYQLDERFSRLYKFRVVDLNLSSLHAFVLYAVLQGLSFSLCSGIVYLRCSSCCSGGISVQKLNLPNTIVVLVVFVSVAVLISRANCSC